MEFNMKKLVKNVGRNPINILGERIEIGEEKEVEITEEVENTFGMSIIVGGSKPKRKKKGDLNDKHIKNE